MRKRNIPHDAIIFVGDGRKALFLRNDGDEKFANFVSEDVFIDDNPMTRDQGSDKPGRAFASAHATRRSAMEPTDWHDIEEHRFAERVSQALERLVRARGAPPRRRLRRIGSPPANRLFGQHVEGPQIGDVVGAEAEAFKLAEKIVETAGEEKVAASRQLANEQAQRRGRVHAAGVVGAQHRQFIEIGEETGAFTQPLPSCFIHGTLGRRAFGFLAPISSKSDAPRRSRNADDAA